MKALILDAQWDVRPDYAITDMERRTRKAIIANSVWRHPKLQVTTLADPQPGPDEVLLRVRAVGICGSDMKMCETDEQGYMLYPGLTKFPCVPGHEFSGEIIEVGKQVHDLKPGDIVAVEDMIKCGDCMACRQDLPNQCENLDEIGFSLHGALAEYVAVKARNCWKVAALRDRYQGDEEKVCEAAATVELTAVSYNALFACAEGFRPGAYAVVYGAGPIGLSAIALLRAAGAARIIAFEISEGRRKLAQAIGADYALDPSQTKPHEAVMELTDGVGAEVNVEAAGAPVQTLPEMEKSLGNDSKIVIIGKAAQHLSIHLETLQNKRAKIFGANGNSGYGCYPNVIRMIACGAFDPRIMITARYGLDQVIEAIDRLSNREDGKIMIRF